MRHTGQCDADLYGYLPSHGIGRYQFILLGEYAKSMDKTWKKWNNFVTSEVWWLKTVEVVVKWEGELHCIGKEAFNKKSDLIQKSLDQPSSAKTYGESIFLKCCVVWMEVKRGLYKKRIFGDFRHLNVMWIWRRMHDESIVDSTKQKQMKIEEVLQMVDTEREMMDTLRSREKRWLGHILRHDSLLRITWTKTREKVVEDQEQCSWIGYWRRRKTISVNELRCWYKTDQDMVSVKMETCHMGRILQHSSRWTDTK